MTAAPIAMASAAPSTPMLGASRALAASAANALLAPSMGVDGAALAMAIGAAVMVAAQLALNAWRRYDVSRFDWRGAGALLGALAAFAVCQRAFDLRLEPAAATIAGLGLLAAFLWLGLRVAPLQLGLRRA